MIRWYVSLINVCFELDVQIRTKYIQIRAFCIFRTNMHGQIRTKWQNVRIDKTYEFT